MKITTIYSMLIITALVVGYVFGHIDAKEQVFHKCMQTNKFTHNDYTFKCEEIE